MAFRCLALRDVALCDVTLPVLCLRLTCCLAASAFTTAEQTSVAFLVILRSCNKPVCCNRVTRFRLKADTAQYTFYFYGSQQVKVGTKSESSDIKPGKSLCCWVLRYI